MEAMIINFKKNYFKYIVRLMLVIGYCLRPILMTPILVYKLIKSEKKIIYIALISLNLAIIAYNFNPPFEYDLQRYFEYMDMVKGYNLEYVIKHIILQPEPISYFFFYLIALTGNYKLMPAMVIFSFYFILMYILFDYAKLKKVSIKYAMIIYLSITLLINYILILSGVRNTIALIIFLLILYYDCIKKKIYKKKNIIYSITILIHSSFIIPVVIVYIYKILKKIKKENWLGIFKVSILFWPIIIIMGMPIIKLLAKIPFLITLYEKIKVYTEAFKIEVHTEFIFKTIVLVLLAILFYYLGKKERNDFFKINQLIMFFTIGSIGYYHIYLRFYTLTILLSMITVMDIFIEDTKLKHKVLLNLAWISVVAFLFQFLVFKGAYVNSIEIVDLIRINIFKIF